MKVVHAHPPMFEEIAAAFPDARRPGVLFCWGDRIYAPGPPRLIGLEFHAHEQVHCERQGSDIEAWWRRYLVDPAFRLEEELPAHIAEFKKLCELQRGRWTSQRAMRRTIAAHVGRKLAAPLYGQMISADAAKRALLDAA
jgi:hypothetical protein